MKSYEQVKAGITHFLDCELMPKLNGVNKWIVGASLAMYLDKGVDLFNDLKNNSLVKSMDIIDNNDMIDIEKLYRYVHREAEKSAVTFKAGIIGDMTLNVHDVENIYSYIMAE